MNFTFTKKNALIFIAALIAAGVVGALFDSQAVGLPILLGAVWYLSSSSKK